MGALDASGIIVTSLVAAAVLPVERLLSAIRRDRGRLGLVATTVVSLAVAFGSITLFTTTRGVGDPYAPVSAADVLEMTVAGIAGATALTGACEVARGDGR